MEFQTPPQPEQKRTLNELKVGDIIYLPKAPWKAIIVENDDLGDLNVGRLSKESFVNAFNAMSEEDKAQIRRANILFDL